MANDYEEKPCECERCSAILKDCEVCGVQGCVICGGFGFREYNRKTGELLPVKPRMCNVVGCGNPLSYTEFLEQDGRCAVCAERFGNKSKLKKMDWSEFIEDNAERYAESDGGVAARKKQLARITEKYVVAQIIDDCGTFDIVGYGSLEEAQKELVVYTQYSSIGLGEVSIAGFKARVETRVLLHLQK